MLVGEGWEGHAPGNKDQLMQVVIKMHTHLYKATYKDDMSLR